MGITFKNTPFFTGSNANIAFTQAKLDPRLYIKTARFGMKFKFIHDIANGSEVRAI